MYLFGGGHTDRYEVMSYCGFDYFFDGLFGYIFSLLIALNIFSYTYKTFSTIQLYLIL